MIHRSPSVGVPFFSPSARENRDGEAVALHAASGAVARKSCAIRRQRAQRAWRPIRLAAEEIPHQRHSKSAAWLAASSSAPRLLRKYQTYRNEALKREVFKSSRRRATSSPIGMLANVSQPGGQRHALEGGRCVSIPVMAAARGPCMPWARPWADKRGKIIKA